jgi:2-oxoglutarate ferredoxin oxidoreductase subunit alpha
LGIHRASVKEHILEIVSDAGEGAQKAGTAFAKASARMGNGLWTEAIIPAEIQPPAHNERSSSGIRIRFGSSFISNGGDLTNLVLVFNEMALLSRVRIGSLADDVTVIIDDIWSRDPSREVREQYRQILAELRDKGGRVVEVPLQEETLKIVEEPNPGKNMFALGLLGFVYDRNMAILKAVVEETFKSKDEELVRTNLELLCAGYAWAESQLDFQFEVPGMKTATPMVAMNGNMALALGSIAAGFELCSMYPITPATSVSMYLAEIFGEFGGLVHQAEDELAAIGVALGANFAGKPAFTVTSGPGMALKTEFMGLAVMTETPLVVVDVQRGGPSTGLPTKIEQGDLLASIFATPGDAPKVVIAASNTGDCFGLMQTARRISEDFRMLVILLSDANLATGVQLFERPVIRLDEIARPVSAGVSYKGDVAYDWEEKTGLSKRLIPGKSREVGMTSSLNHSRQGLVCYDAESNERAHRMRSHKLAALQKTLKPPPIHGDRQGDLLVVGWGSTRGAIEEAVDRLRVKGLNVSSLHLVFLNPMPLELKEIFGRFKKVMTVEINFADAPDDEFVGEGRRCSQLAFLLRGLTLVDVDCYAKVWGRALRPMEIAQALEEKIKSIK